MIVHHFPPSRGRSISSTLTSANRAPALPPCPLPFESSFASSIATGSPNDTRRLLDLTDRCRVCTGETEVIAASDDVRLRDPDGFEAGLFGGKRGLSPLGPSGAMPLGVVLFLGLGLASGGVAAGLFLGLASDGVAAGLLVSFTFTSGGEVAGLLLGLASDGVDANFLLGLASDGVDAVFLLGLTSDGVDAGLFLGLPPGGVSANFLLDLASGGVDIDLLDLASDWIDVCFLLGFESVGVEADRLGFLTSDGVYAVLVLDGVGVFFLGVEDLEALVVELDGVEDLEALVVGFDAGDDTKGVEGSGIVNLETVQQRITRGRSYATVCLIFCCDVVGDGHRHGAVVLQTAK